ncbi:MAG: hypothetical protein PHV28_14455, partial [Kiritimatiellae bacterium]|nr:hypothetical protein [Kiritimatiellia bacterium]
MTTPAVPTIAMARRLAAHVLICLFISFNSFFYGRGFALVPRWFIHAFILNRRCQGIMFFLSSFQHEASMLCRLRVSTRTMRIIALDQAKQKGAS